MYINWKKVYALVTAAFILVNSSGCGRDNKEKTAENTVGYKNVSLWFPEVGEENFVILNVGDHEKTGVSSQEKKMKYCNDNDISLGFIISSNAVNSKDIYNDVELAKGIIAEHNIDMPVYLCVDKIIENDSLNLDTKSNLINCFLQKCSTNGMYVGIYGTDTNLTLLKKYCSINLDEYDAFLVMDKEEITYDGTCSIIEGLDGNIKANKNLAEIITKKELNSSSKFVNDGAYIVKETDSIQEIAMKFGFSVDELLEFNGLGAKDVKAGAKLRIPSITRGLEFPVLDEPQLGVDLSHYQGTNIDWNKLSDVASYIIFKVNQGYVVDPCFLENSKKCAEYDIPIGGYCYNAWLGFEASTGIRLYDDNRFKALQEEQADKFIETVKERDLIFPAYLDIELISGVSAKQVFSNEQVKIMLDVWHDKMNEQGYLPGLYCNKSMYNDLSEMYGSDLSEKFELWIAGGTQYVGDESKDFTKEEIIVPESPQVSYLKTNYIADTLQVTNCGYGFGAGNNADHVDVNYNFTNYMEPIVISGKTDFETKEFDRSNIGTGEILGGVVAGVAIIGGAATAAIITKRKIKNRL